MISEATSPEEVKFDPYQEYVPIDGDWRIWEYLCFDYYRTYAAVVAYFDLVLKELMSASIRKGKAPQNDAITSVLESVLHEFGVLQKNNPFDPRKLGPVEFLLYDDLVKCGSWLMSKGVKVKDLHGFMVIGKESLLDRSKKTAGLYLSPEGQSAFGLDYLEKYKPRQYKNTRKYVRSVLTSFRKIDPYANVPALEDLTGLFLELKLGFASKLQASDITRAGTLRKSGESARRKINQIQKWSREILLYHIVNVLKEYSIEPLYQVSARLMNSLVYYPIYHIEKDSDTYKSKGEEKLRTQYRREKRSRASKKNQK